MVKRLRLFEREIFLFGPLGPFSVAVAWHKRNKHKHCGQHDPISQEKAADTTLGKNPDDGLYLRYCSLSGLFVSGSRCLPYREKLISCQKGLDVASIKKLPQMGHTECISHLGQ